MKASDFNSLRKGVRKISDTLLIKEKHMENVDSEYAEIEIPKSDAEKYGVDVRPEAEFDKENGDEQKN